MALSTHRKSKSTRTKIAVLAGISLIGSALAITAATRSASAALANTVIKTDGVGYPSGGTTYNLDIEVFDEHTIGNTVFVAGKFTKVWDRTKSRWIDQAYLAAFDGTTGRVLPFFRPRLEAPVYALDVIGDKLLIGGEFRSVNGLPDTSGLALLDPTTSEVVPGWISSVTKSDGTRPKVQDLWVTNSHVYLAGNYSTVFGGTPSANTTVWGYSGIGRVARTDGRPDAAWKPTAVGPVWTVAVSADGNRVHVGGNFNSVAGQGPNLATLTTTTGTAVAGWDVSKPPSWTNIAGTVYWRGLGFAVFDLEIYNNMVWIGGAEHGYAAKLSTTGQTVISKGTAHDTQRVAVFGDKVYIGCHCRSYQTGNTVGDLPFFELDATTGAQTSTFSQYLEGADGGWAITKTPDGCVWPGGDFWAGRAADGSRTSVMGFAKICDTSGPQPHNVAGIANNVVGDTAQPSTPQNLAVTIVGGKPRLAWSASNDDKREIGYRIFRDGQMVGATRSTTWTDSVAATEPHSWMVVAVDGVGKTSAPSNKVSLAGGAATQLMLAAPIEQAGPRRFESRVEFSVNAPASNVAYVEASKDGVVVERFYNDENLPVTNVALNRPVRFSNGLAPASLTDGVCCNTANLNTPTTANPYIDIDLGATFSIEGIQRLLNGLVGANLPNTYFLIRDTPFTETDPEVAAAATGTTSVSATMVLVSFMQPITGTGRYVRIWTKCASCTITVTELRVWGGGVRAPLIMSIPGGAGTYTFRSVGVDGTKSEPLTYSISSATPFVTESWTKAVDVVATQSSTNGSAAADRAIDRNIDGVLAGGSVAVTGEAAAPLSGPGTPAVASSLSQYISTSTPAKAIDGNTDGLWASASSFASRAGSGSDTNLLRAAGATVSQSGDVDQMVAARAVDGNTDGNAAAGSVAGASQPAGAGAGGSVNWARKPGVVATQSSNFAVGTGPEKAIDGQTTTQLGSYSYTARGSAGWWRVDLGAARVISDIQVWPRTDERWWFASNVRVFVSAEPITGTTLAAVAATPGVWSFDITTTPKQGQRYPIGRSGRYIQMFRLDADSFAATEIAINGEEAASSTAYWQADLGSSKAVDGVTLWPRTDCCVEQSRNVRILFSETPFTSADVSVVSAAAGVTFTDVATVGQATKVATPASTRYIRVQKLDGGQLSLAEVSASGPVVRQWWQMDLGSVQFVDTVKVFARTDCCGTQSSNYWVYASPTPFVGDSPATAQAKADVKVISVPGGGNQVLNIGMNARFIRVQKADESILTLAEVQAFGRATPQWWQADLGKVRDMRYVRLYPRTDCCADSLANIRILYSDVPFVSDDPTQAIQQSGVTYRDIAATPTVGQMYWVGRRARYIRIQRLAGGPLSVAEVVMVGNQE